VVPRVLLAIDAAVMIVALLRIAGLARGVSVAAAR
jgi:hypothetical protein